MTAPAIIEARALGRRYGKQWAVRGVDLTLRAGERVGVIAPDGAGKTTLLQMLAAILDPSEGECRVFGLATDQHGKAIAARLGYMTQGFTLYDRLSVDENIRLAARLRGVDEHIYPQRRDALLAMAGLSPFTDRRAGQLSGGMRKKLSLCTILVHQPSLLILDEPGLGVDPLSRRQLWDMLMQYQAQGIAIIVASSYMDEAERCDRVLLLSEGRVLATGTPAQLRARARGRVFEWRHADPLAAATQLQDLPGLRAIQILPDRVRVQRESAVTGVAIAGAPALLAVEPNLEDVFVLAADSTDTAVNAPMLEPPSPAATGGFAAEALSVRFGRFIAVDAVSLSAHPGELLALLGPNGAGKTTLIRALCGLATPSSGRGQVAGIALGGEANRLRQRIGYMSQRFSLYLDLTPAENLQFFASAYGLSGDVARRAIAWSGTQSGIALDEPRLVGDLSAAARQRLALACSILHRPAVLFLDEPTSGIDPLARYRFWAFIRQLAAGGMTILVTTHYLEEARYCDRIGLMHRGRLIALGDLAALRAEAGSAPDASIETVFVRAIEQAERADARGQVA